MVKVIKPGKGKTAGYANYPTLSFGNPTKTTAKATPFDPLSAWDAYNTTIAGINKTKLPTLKSLMPDMSAYTQMARLAQGNILTPAQITQQASKTAITEEKAVLAAMKALSDQSVAAYNQQADRAQGFAQALAKLQAGEPGAAEASYTRAANTLQGLGAGLAGEVGRTYQEAADRTAADVAAATGGLGVVSAPSGAGSIATPSQYANVTIPAGTLAESAVNARRLAAADAIARETNVDIIGQNYRSQANQAIEQAASDMRAQVAKRPATIQELVNQLNQNRQTGITNLVNVLGQRATAAQTAKVNAWNMLSGLRKERTDAANTAFTQLMSQLQFGLAKTTLEGNQRLQAAQILGIDPVTGKPTFTRQQWLAQNATTRKSWAISAGNQMGFQYDWKTGQPKTDAKGNYIPIAGYSLNPKDPTGHSVIATPKPTTPAKQKISPELSAVSKLWTYEDGTLLVGRDGKPVPYKAPADPDKAKKVSSELSEASGVWTYEDGTKMKGSDGKTVPYKAPAKAGKEPTFSVSDVSTLATDIEKWHTGVTGTADGEQVINPDAQLTWNEAYSRALARLPNTKAGKTKALQLVNAEFGTPDSIAENTIRAGKKDGLNLTDNIKFVLQHVAARDLPVPPQYAFAAIARVYGVKPIDVRTVANQLLQWMASNGE